ncbi:MAG TPA: tryptophan--tRNA ligase [Candidatus Saccharimonadales bacterium]|nr:tryptophan--tRNA ligase [Candidatus Saccharimonadales bacterium]
MSTALTGIRPTGGLTVANYVGAMRPMVELQDTFPGPVNVFVADLHALTDQEPGVVAENRLDTVRSYLAAGIDPSRTSLYLQSQIGRPTVELASLLDRHYSLAELMRVPTLKDKLREKSTSSTEEDSLVATASVALARYPILMAADILIAGADHVPVGADQIPHIEITRTLARRFNTAYGAGETVLIEPDLTVVEGIKIAALNGDPKMSKSKPNGAIFLNDSPDAVAGKIKRAQTAAAGEMTTALESHFLLAERLAGTQEERDRLRDLRSAHMDGQPVMGPFKRLFTEVTVDFLRGYQARYGDIADADVKHTLTRGGESASEKAEEVMGRVYAALGLVSVLS